MKSIKIKLIVLSLVVVVFAGSLFACECYWWVAPPCVFFCYFIEDSLVYITTTDLYWLPVCQISEDPGCICPRIIETKICADVRVYFGSLCTGTYFEDQYVLTENFPDMSTADNCFLCEPLE